MLIGLPNASAQPRKAAQRPDVGWSALLALLPSPV
jgi:hypothetical protein